MKPLLRLPNGAHVDPETVTSVNPLRGYDGLDGPSVIVRGTNDLCIEIPATDNTHAVQLADEIAKAVNEARG